MYNLPYLRYNQPERPSELPRTPSFCVENLCSLQLTNMNDMSRPGHSWNQSISYHVAQVAVKLSRPRIPNSDIEKCGWNICGGVCLPSPTQAGSKAPSTGSKSGLDHGSLGACGLRSSSNSPVAIFGGAATESHHSVNPRTCIHLQKISRHQPHRHLQAD